MDAIFKCDLGESVDRPPHYLNGMQALPRVADEVVEIGGKEQGVGANNICNAGFIQTLG